MRGRVCLRASDDASRSLRLWPTEWARLAAALGIALGYACVGFIALYGRVHTGCMHRVTMLDRLAELVFSHAIVICHLVMANEAMGRFLVLLSVGLLWGALLIWMMPFPAGSLGATTAAPETTGRRVRRSRAIAARIGIVLLVLASLVASYRCCPSGSRSDPLVVGAWRSLPEFVDAYVGEHGHLPRSIDDLAQWLQHGTGTAHEPRIIDDEWGSRVELVLTTGGYSVVSAGPDRRFGTTDDERIDR